MGSLRNTSLGYMVKCHESENLGPQRGVKEISSNQYYISTMYLGGFEGKTVKVGNTKSQNWICGGLEKGKVENPCHHATARCI